MRDEEVAAEIIKRLNALIENADVRKDIGSLIKTRIPCSEATANHPTIQAGIESGSGQITFGLLGLLNGLVGTIPDGKFSGWGFIAAVFEEDGSLAEFQPFVPLGKEPAPESGP